jgi:hypothetical protein
VTEDERQREGAEEAIEDLEAPAAAQDDVAGGGICGYHSCGVPSMICDGTCNNTTAECTWQSKRIIVKVQ